MKSLRRRDTPPIPTRSPIRHPRHRPRPEFGKIGRPGARGRGVAMFVPWTIVTEAFDVGEGFAKVVDAVLSSCLREEKGCAGELDRVGGGEMEGRVRTDHPRACIKGTRRGRQTRGIGRRRRPAHTPTQPSGFTSYNIVFSSENAHLLRGRALRRILSGERTCGYAETRFPSWPKYSRHEARD